HHAEAPLRDASLIHRPLFAHGEKRRMKPFSTMETTRLWPCLPWPCLLSLLPVCRPCRPREVEPPAHRPGPCPRQGIPPVFAPALHALFSFGAKLFCSAEDWRYNVANFPTLSRR